MGLVRKWVFFSFPSIIGYCRLSVPGINCLSYNLKVNCRSDQDNNGQSLEAK